MEEEEEEGLIEAVEEEEEEEGLTEPVDDLAAAVDEETGHTEATGKREKRRE